MMINACHSWRRARGQWAHPLEEITIAAPSYLEPLQLLLVRERQRAVREALLSLAPANRLALLMHVWGDYSYADITRLLHIAVSTVDGRIYRAKQQLRRLLRDQGDDLDNTLRHQ